MNVKITGQKGQKKVLHNSLISAPVSKSEMHRLLICAALSDSPTKIFYKGNARYFSDDISATINCLRSLGAKIDFTGSNFLSVAPIKNVPEFAELNCGESGSTLRFMLPVATALCEHVKFTGCGRLPQRPISELVNALKMHGVKFSSERLPFETFGKIETEQKTANFEMSGSVSSQYISGLMLALPKVSINSTIKLTSPLKSASYVDITISALKKFGVNVEFSGGEYKITGKKFKVSDVVTADGDWSGAAFFLAAGALGTPVSVSGLNINSPQGDKKILDFLRNFGADVKICDDIVTVSPAKKAKNNYTQLEIDIDPTPDLLPVLAITAMCLGLDVNFYGASRLRLKESDRIASTASVIRSLGGEALEKPDALFVNGHKKRLADFSSFLPVRGFHDHRIVMSAAIAALNCRHDVIITDAEATQKSYPEFFNDYKSLGGCCINVL